MPIRSVHVGLGPIGRMALRGALGAGLVPVAAVDSDLRLLGSDAGELAGQGPLGLVVAGDLLALPAAEVAIVCTTSRLAAAADQLEELLRSGLSVVSSCEELVYPWRSHPDLARRLDAAARDAGAVLVGTGVNPGFVMDALVLDLARACGRVTAVRVQRRVDVSRRRHQLQRKVGLGLSREEFERAVASGGLGHVGLRQSVEMVADVLALGDGQVEVAMEPVLAEREVETPGSRVAAGCCLGMRQLAVVNQGGRVVVSMELVMAYGLPDARDSVSIEGDPSIAMEIPDGVSGDAATVAMLVDVARNLAGVSPGLRCMPEIPVSARRPVPGLPHAAGDSSP